MINLGFEARSLVAAGLEWKEGVFYAADVRQVMIVWSFRTVRRTVAGHLADVFENCANPRAGAADRTFVRRNARGMAIFAFSGAWHPSKP